MQLDEFITNSLKAIIKGIKDSQDFAKENGARINPYIEKLDIGKIPIVFYGSEGGARALTKIDFDIAVTSSNIQESGGEGGINVLSVKIGGKLSDIDKNENVSRIQFSINVALPNVEP